MRGEISKAFYANVTVDRILDRSLAAVHLGLRFYGSSSVCVLCPRQSSINMQLIVKKASLLLLLLNFPFYSIFQLFEFLDEINCFCHN